MNIEQEFAKKILNNYNGFVHDWLKLEPTYLIEKAEEIAATKQMYDVLSRIASSEEKEYLMRFENPLEVMRDQWMTGHDLELNPITMDEDVSSAFWTVMNKRDAEQDYALDPAYIKQNGGQTMC